VHRPVVTADGQAIAPRDVGARRIGHFGFFRTSFEASLWRAHLLPELA